MNGPNKSVEERFRRLRLLQLCCVPGCYAGPVEFAHKQKTPLSEVHRGRGRKERFYDILKHPDCYLPLCKPHHRAYDAGELQVSGCVIFGWLIPSGA